MNIQILNVFVTCMFYMSNEEAIFTRKINHPCLLSFTNIYCLIARVVGLLASRHEFLIVHES